MPQFHTNQQFGGCFVAALSYKKFTPGECVASFAFAHGIAIKGKTYSEERPMPNPCNCFATCTLSDANRFLERIPRVVTSASSPWLSYLRFVYGAEPPLREPCCATLSLGLNDCRCCVLIHSTGRRRLSTCRPLPVPGVEHFKDLCFGVVHTPIYVTYPLV